jgi:hypothetical protein
MTKTTWFLLVILLISNGYTTWRLVKYERKLKEVAMGYQFLMLTTRVDEKGMEVWQKMKDNGTADKLFTWDISQPLLERSVNSHQSSSSSN